MSSLNTTLYDVQNAMKAVSQKLDKNDERFGKLADEITLLKMEQEKQYNGLRAAMQRTPSDYGGKLMSQQMAKQFGYLALALSGNNDARTKCEGEFGISMKTMTEGEAAAGGALVPEDMGNEIIRLQDTFGVIRQLSRVVPMSRDSQPWPAIGSGLTVYGVGEGVTITASDIGLTLVNLVARKWGVLTAISSELMEDAVIAVGELVAEEIARAFAQKDDDTAINGDGTSDYLGVNGIRNALQAGSLKEGSGNAYSELTLADFEDVVGMLPDYADDENTTWLVSRRFFFSTMYRLALAAGGANATEILMGMGSGKRTFLSYPVRFSAKMPSTEANSQVCATFGSFRLGCMLGERRSVTIARSTDVYFKEDMIGIRGTKRQDFVCHGRGTDTVAGPIIGLKTAAA